MARSPASGVRTGLDSAASLYRVWRSVVRELAGGWPFGSDAAGLVTGRSLLTRDGPPRSVRHPHADGEPFPGGWFPQETVSREQALAGFTADAAFAGFAEGRFGRLIPGERADFLLVRPRPAFRLARRDPSDQGHRRVGRRGESQRRVRFTLPAACFGLVCRALGLDLAFLEPHQQQ